MEDNRSIKEMEYTGYLFVYFTGEKYDDGEQIYFAVSKDGLNWIDLNDNKPVLTSHLGEKGVRDPFIIRSACGDKFYLIATDLKINGDGNWKRATTTGSKCLMKWESDDLISWSDQRMIQISRDDAGCTWAPEATYDKTTGDYIVYWASTIEKDNFSRQRVYYAKTKDFEAYSTPQLYIEREDHILDTTIIEDNGVYYRVSNDGAYGCNALECVSELLSKDAKHIPAPYLEAQKGVEGPFVFKFNNENKWCLLLDECEGIGYYPLITTDLASGEFKRPEESFKMPTRARHGSVISITSSEYDALLEK